MDLDALHGSAENTAKYQFASHSFQLIEGPFLSFLKSSFSLHLISSTKKLLSLSQSGVTCAHDHGPEFLDCWTKPEESWKLMICQTLFPACFLYVQTLCMMTLTGQMPESLILFKIFFNLIVSIGCAVIVLHPYKSTGSTNTLSHYSGRQERNTILNKKDLKQICTCTKLKAMLHC